MKNIIILTIFISISNYSIAADRKPLIDVDIDELTAELQGFNFPESGNNHMALVWWIPIEFWKSIFSKDLTLSKTEKDEYIDAMSGVSLLAIVQADISSFGAFNFYSSYEIEEQALIYFTDRTGKRNKISLMQELNLELEIILSLFKPILGAAMGNMGDNFHFYVLDDKLNSSYRLLNPYREGSLHVQLAKRTDELMEGFIEMPLNSLYIPRKCPNGKDAHISWTFCPWTGQRLMR